MDFRKSRKVHYQYGVSSSLYADSRPTGSKKIRGDIGSSKEKRNSLYLLWEARRTGETETFMAGISVFSTSFYMCHVLNPIASVVCLKKQVAWLFSLGCLLEG